MNQPRPQWRKIAELLADRLATHAFCGQHHASTPDPDCPFCGDRAAYQAYLAAGGNDYRPKPPAGGKAVLLQELLSGTRKEQR